MTTQKAVHNIEIDDEPDTVPVYKSPDIIKKKIEVKFYDSACKSYVVDAQSIIRRKKSTGTFYEGLVMRFNKDTERDGWEQALCIRNKENQCKCKPN